MEKRDKLKEKDDSMFIFQGTKLNSFEAKQTGIGIISGIIGIVLAVIIFESENKILNMIFIFICSAIGYFGYGLLQNNRRDKDK